jgi:hypothetical protein
MAYDVVAGKPHIILKDGSRSTGADDARELGESESKPSARNIPGSKGTQFFLHPDASDEQISALATAIVAQAAKNRKENGAP